MWRIIKPDENLMVDLNDLREKLEIYKNRPFKIGHSRPVQMLQALSLPYHQMAKIMHENGGYVLLTLPLSAP